MENPGAILRIAWPGAPPFPAPPGDMKQIMDSAPGILQNRIYFDNQLGIMTRPNRVALVWRPM
jgi:hypothetical protein